MFNHHLSQSHPPPVHRSEETGLHNPLHPVQNKSWQSLLLALAATWPGCSGSIYFIAIIKHGKFYTNTQTDILFTQTYYFRQ